MEKQTRSPFHRFLIPVLFLFIEGFLFITNYTPGTWLLGWDNVMPELNPTLNFSRNISSVWQEYRGLGLQDGMSHAANLVHTVIIRILFLFFSRNMLRYIFIFGMHLAGGIGMYVLVGLLQKTPKNRWIQMLAACFYLFNAFTIQMFFAPLEAFAVHFASLPWIAFSYTKYLLHGGKKNFLLFLLICLLVSPQFFITPLLLSLAFVLIAITLTNLHFWKHASGALIAFFLINAFWLLPFLQAVPYVGPIIQTAKINQMSTGEIFLRNQQYGDFQSVALMRGFGLDFIDLMSNESNGWMMYPWRLHLFSPTVTGIYWGIFAVTFSGICLHVLHMINKRKGNQYTPYIFLTFLGFFVLGNNIPGFREVNNLIRTNVPFIGEAFRFPFTKFSLFYAFAYTIIFSAAVSDFAGYIRGVKLKRVIYISVFIMFAYTCLPAFKGNFIYANLRIALPPEYRQLFTFMSTKDPSGRTALLPQPDYWNWKYYTFGYRGSGFLWHGIPQPTLDRAFDPWGHENEQYYWELSRALFSNDAVALKNVFAKFDVKYIIVDGNQRTMNHGMSLHIPSIFQMLSENPGIREIATFNTIKVYDRSDSVSKYFLSLSPSLPSVSPAFNWTDNDIAFQQIGNYSASSAPNYYYPYRSLFTKRSVKEREFTVMDSPETITISVPSIPQTSVQGLVPTATSSATIFVDTDSVSTDINKDANIVFDSFGNSGFNAGAAKECALLKNGEVVTSEIQRFEGNVIRLQSKNQRACFSIWAGMIPHADSYLVQVEYRHIAGRPLTFALTNETAHHTELETYLSDKTTEFTTDYFILPPLASDGLGYSAYFANDSIGREETVNEISRIRFYKIPYNEMVNLQVGSSGFEVGSSGFEVESLDYKLSKVEHPNPSYYKLIIQPLTSNPQPPTLILSQSYHPGWKAYFTDNSWLQNTFPFLFAQQLPNHVLVNNWENGWVLDQPSNQTIVIFFLPQLLQWIGFVLLPIPFFFLLAPRSFPSVVGPIPFLWICLKR